MNIWSWVDDTCRDLSENGHGRLAYIVQVLPGAGIGHRFAEADALAYEGLGLARSLRLPWVEVYLRHWQLQARIANRGDGAVALSDAVAALEAAHRDETKDCPQSICTVQDLAICYGNTDGVGWANERLAVSEEALGAINPSWPCFECINAEQAAALIDLDRPADALAVLDDVRAAVVKPVKDEFVTIVTRLGALLALEQWADCVREADEYIAYSEDEARRDQVRIRRAYALARMGRFEDAAASLPEAEAVAPKDMDWWARAVQLLAHAGAVENDWRLGAVLRRAVGELEAAGAWRRGAEVALVHGDLAVARGRRRVAAEAVELMRRLAANLRDPASMASDLAALEARVSELDAAGGVGVAGSADEVLAQMGEDEREVPDPEEDLDVLAAAQEAWPDHGGVAVRMAMALAASGDLASAIAVLDPMVTGKADDDDDVTGMLVQLRLAENDESAISALADRVRAEQPAMSHWILARLAAQRGVWEEAVAQCRQILAIEPEAVNTRRLLAAAARRLGRFAEAVEALVELRGLEGGEGAEESDDWELLVNASAAQDWAVVRETAARLGMEVPPGDGPIEEETHGLVVRYTEEGDHEELAVRTGPATARVVSVSHPAREQRFGDVVVFDPAPLEPVDEDGDRYMVFAHVADIGKGGFNGYSLEGAEPAEGAWPALRERVDAVGAGVWVLSAGDYQVWDEGEELPGFYAVVAVRPGDEAAVHQAVSAAVAGFGGLLAWPELAAAAGDEAAAVEHTALLERISSPPQE